MRGVTAVAVALACLAGVLPFAPRPSISAPSAFPTGRSSEAVLRRLRVPISALAAYGAWTLLGGLVGVIGGVAAGALAWRVLSKVESPAVAERRRRLQRDLPFAVHLLAGLVASGAEVAAAMHDVAEAIGGPVAVEWRFIRRELAISGDPVLVWRRVGDVEGLQGMGLAMARSFDSGAPVTDTLARLAEDLTDRARHELEARVRTIEVRAAGPLGVCFLPAFVILGVLPAVVSMFSQMSFLP